VALDDLGLGTLVIAERVLAEDGASRALGAAGVLEPDRELLAGLRAAGPDAAVGPVVSADLYYEDRERRAGSGAVAVELSAGALLAVAARRGARAACVLAVAESPAGRIDPEALEAAEVELGRVGAAALD
jgi:uridine phosphorylase